MTLEELREICLSLPSVTEDMKWEDHLCFNIGGKMFLITSPDRVPVSATFKANESDYELLIAREGFMPAPYLARNKWVFLDNINGISKEEWKTLAAKSYNLIYEKLPVKIKKQIKNK